MGAGNRVCIWGEILQEVSRKGFLWRGKNGFFCLAFLGLGAKGVWAVIGRQWTRCCSRMERVLVKSEDWMPHTWAVDLLVLSGAGADASAV